MIALSVFVLACVWALARIKYVALAGGFGRVYCWLATVRLDVWARKAFYGEVLVDFEERLWHDIRRGLTPEEVLLNVLLRLTDMSRGMLALRSECEQIALNQQPKAAAIYRSSVSLQDEIHVSEGIIAIVARHPITEDTRFSKAVRENWEEILRTVNEKGGR